MGIVIDLIVIFFVLSSIFYGYKKGLAKVGLRMLGFLIGILIAFVLYKPISMMIIENTTIDEMIQDKMINNMGVQQEEQVNYIEKSIVDSTQNDILSGLAKPLSYNLIYISVMFLLFIISKIILLFIASLTDVVTSIPIINQFNKIGGILYGIIVSFFVIDVVLLIISFAAKYSFNNQIYNIINSTYITKVLYEYNILNIFFM